MTGSIYDTTTHIVAYKTSASSSTRMGGFESLIKTVTANFTHYGEICYYIGANVPDGATVDGRFRIMVEMGNMSTDWTPAPEDTDDAIVNVASNISESLENIDGTLNDFANTLEEQSTDIGESINEVQDQLNALREDFESEVNAREQ